MNNLILYQPTKAQIAQSQMHEFLSMMEKKYNCRFNDYAAFHQWSVDHPDLFWANFWDYADVITHEPFYKVRDKEKIFWKTQWFVGAKLNFAENLLRYRDGHEAIIFADERGMQSRYTYKKLYDAVAKLVSFLQEKGIRKGDCLAGYLPNRPEAIIAMLATTALGAIWTSTSPDFGEEAVIARFGQVEPKILFGVDGYIYNGKIISTIEKLDGIRHAISSIEHVIVIQVIAEKKLPASMISYEEIQKVDEIKPIQFISVEANDPVYILYSSGTTGLPKTIVHRVAGVLIQHLKEHKLHTDLTREDVFFYYTTTAWMMWNWLVSGLASGCTIVCYDGCPTFPNVDSLWQLVDEIGITVFGTSAKYLATLHEKKLNIKEKFQLKSLRTILSTGSILSDYCFDYVYQHIKSTVMLSSISGGTDIVSCFILGNPILPVYRGELQSIGLGMDVKAFNSDGIAIIDQQGELVCVSPAPCMPIGFLHDPDDKRFIASYFSAFPHVWYHGDFIKINLHGGVKILGRSDATLNPGGVRIGTADIYAAIESLPEVIDSVVVGQRWHDDERVILFVTLKEAVVLNQELINKIKQQIRAQCTPRHVPAKIISVQDIPYTINGKKVELAVKNIIHGLPVKNSAILKNPASLSYFMALEELASE